MVKVQLFIKKYNRAEDYYKKEYLDSKEFPQPQSHDDFISDILKAFNIKKNEKWPNIIGYTKDEDEIPINCQKDLDAFKDKTVEYRITEITESSPFKTEPTKFENIKEKEEEEKEDDDEESEDDGKLDDIDIKIDANLIISDKEMENIIDSQIKPIPEIQTVIYNDNLQFDIEKYKEEISNKNKNIINDFIKSYDSKINSLFNKKSSLLREKINKMFKEYSTVSVNGVYEIKKECSYLKEDFYESVRDINECNIAMIQLSKLFSSGEIGFPEKKILKKQNNIMDIKDIYDKNKKPIIFKNEAINNKIDLKKAKCIEITITNNNNNDEISKNKKKYSFKGKKRINKRISKGKEIKRRKK